jgi:tetratricopeptide (TPR) repeat protein
MAEPSDSIPKLTPEQRQMVATLATRAKQVLATGNLDDAITLYLDCCKRDPTNFPWRQELRKTEKLKYKDNKKGKALAFLSTWRPGLKMETFSKTGNHLKAIEFAEEVLRFNPWHLRALIVSAHAFDALGLKDLALWSFDQARQIEANNPTINRQMARLFEERGQFPQAIQLWKMVAAKLPNRHQHDRFQRRKRMTQNVSLICRHSFDAQKLVSEYPPKFTHPNKQAVYDVACPPGSSHSGTIVFSRWRVMDLPAEFDGEKLQTSFEAREDYFRYEPPPPGQPVVEWYLNFAHQSLFTAYGGPLFAQDEMQVAEHPVLGSLRRCLLRTDITHLTVEDGVPTPILVAGAERRCRIAIDRNAEQGRPAGLYGNHFAKASPEVIQRATQPIVPPTTTNLIAMEAPSYGAGRYSRADIEYILATLMTGFSAACLESRREDGPTTDVVIHTGFWGCGAYGGNRALMALLQILGAYMSNVTWLVFHAGDQAGAQCFSESLRVMQEELAAGQQRQNVAQLIARIEARGYEWGVSDGN